MVSDEKYLDLFCNIAERSVVPKECNSLWEYILKHRMDISFHFEGYLLKIKCRMGSYTEEFHIKEENIRLCDDFEVMVLEMLKKDFGNL